MNHTVLQSLIATHFNLSELRQLCRDLGVPHEDIAGTTLSDKAAELIHYFERRGRLRELHQKCADVRPRVSWDAALDGSSRPGSPNSSSSSGSLEIRRVFQAPRHYSLAAVQVGLLHPLLFDALDELTGGTPPGNGPSIDVGWEGEKHEKEMVGPFVLRKPGQQRSTLLYLVTTEPEYSPAIRKNSISLPVRVREYLGLQPGPSPVEISPGPNLRSGTLTLVPFSDDQLDDWEEWEDEEEDDEEEE